MSPNLFPKLSLKKYYSPTGHIFEKINLFLIVTFLLFAFPTNSVGQEEEKKEDEESNGIEPPNYDFSLKKLDVFLPGNKIEDLEKVYGKGEEISNESGILYKKYKIKQLRYIFTVYVQFFENAVLDFYTRLPYYFLHDIYHQSLIKRYRKQDVYKKTNESAIYIWNDRKGIKHIYSGACTITCFPLYYTAIINKVPDSASSFKPIMLQLVQDAYKQ